MINFIFLFVYCILICKSYIFFIIFLPQAPFSKNYAKDNFAGFIWSDMGALFNRHLGLRRHEIVRLSPDMPWKLCTCFSLFMWKKFLFIITIKLLVWNALSLMAILLFLFFWGVRAHPYILGALVQHDCANCCFIIFFHYTRFILVFISICWMFELQMYLFVFFKCQKWNVF